MPRRLTISPHRGQHLCGCGVCHTVEITHYNTFQTLTHSLYNIHFNTFQTLGSSAPCLFSSPGPSGPPPAGGNILNCFIMLPPAPTQAAEMIGCEPAVTLSSTAHAESSTCAMPVYRMMSRSALYSLPSLAYLRGCQSQLIHHRRLLPRQASTLAGTMVYTQALFTQAHKLKVQSTWVAKESTQRDLHTSRQQPPALRPGASATCCVGQCTLRIRQSHSKSSKGITDRRELSPRIRIAVCAASMRSIASSLPLLSRSLFL